MALIFIHKLAKFTQYLELLHIYIDKLKKD